MSSQADGGQPIVQAGLVQFSNGACVELPLGIPKAEAVEDCISGMVRGRCKGGFQCALALGRVMSVHHQALQHSSLHCVVQQRLIMLDSRCSPSGQPLPCANWTAAVLPPHWALYQAKLVRASF